ncbi:ATP cone domain-containing protein [Gemmatimonas sp.]|jgi:ribonucleoside-triphosphate reductase|uniref:ATP cone domain-containing protein n=1 Tax=Gemmatimonas sp. TaxID=1962908 RepID=UPI0022C281A6|nr:ATP cone domain-containing protein [Gemmatimonas sp.]MCZ8013537.1 ATP cone domain-containing protein [Gemmatimonas sp.]MCZ8265793.1 ATP cone domain-containing protein [Gemmatimonas sp.]
MSTSVAPRTASEVRSTFGGYDAAGVRAITEVVKRDGRRAPWDPERITRAIALAFWASRHDDAPNPHANDAAHRFGLGFTEFADVCEITQLVVNTVERKALERTPTVEDVQDIVEMMIAARGHWDVAKRYVIYRAARAQVRLAAHGENGLQDYIFLSRYSRYREELGRRETPAEAFTRVMDMHRAHFADKLDLPVAGFGGRPLRELIDETEAALQRRAILPSMRSLQFGGQAIEANNARMFNCAFTHMNRLDAFKEAFFLLMSGTGVGFSVQKHHVAQLPHFPVRGAENDLEVVHYTVGDTLEGWADALDALMRSYLDNKKIEFNYSGIRRRGSPLKTSGGRAPGHIPLKKALSAVERMLDQVSGRALRPIEVYDILMHVAVAVLSGGIRRSATICLFSADDDEMAAAKTGNWFETNPQRGKSNNSAVLVRHQHTEQDFARLFELQKEFGEPGFYFVDDVEYGANPCVEIGLAPFAVVDEAAQTKLAEYGMPDVPVGSKVSGWQMCNLTTINANACDDEAGFLACCRAAALLGTLQAAYTNIGYLGAATRYINERESLLGVSICGILDRPSLLLNPAVLERGARECLDTNAAIAEHLGIPAAARITCVKPEGTASLVLGAGSGIHPHHARHYFRRVQAARTEPLYQWFKLNNPHMTEASAWDPDTTDVITFPVTAPTDAILRKDVGAVQFLEYVRLVQQHWVVAGRRHESYNPGLHHNVSNTVTVRDDEWDAVQQFIFENRGYFTGISLLRETGDKVYAQAPREEVTTDMDMAKWNALVYSPVDYTALWEGTDMTTLADTVACAGGACEIV